MATKTKQNGSAKATNLLTDWAKQAQTAFENATKTTEEMNKEFMNSFAGKNNDYFKNWMETQQAFWSKNDTKSNGTNPTDFFTNWYQQQMNQAQNMMSQNMMKEMMEKNPMAKMMDMENNPMADAMNMGNHAEAWQKASEQMMDWNKNMTTNFQEQLNTMMSGDQKGFFTTMFNNADTYTKMFQTWMPMMEQLQNGKFDMETFTKSFSPEMTKEIMDKMFAFMPDNNMNEMYSNWMNQIQKMSNNDWLESNPAYQNMKSHMENNMQNGMNQPFEQMMNMYNMMQGQFDHASNPFMKMMTPNADKKMVETMREINDKMVKFNMKNTQMKFMMYEKGSRAMQNFATTLSEKVQKGENIENFMAFYTEFLNTMDAEMVELFGSEHFSQLQSEMSSLGFRLKKQMDEQMENTLSNLPIVTRTEMDSMYKSMYEMNKELRNLLRQNATTVTETAKKATSTVKKAMKSTVKTATKAAPKAKETTAKKASSKATAKKASPKATAKKTVAKKTTAKKATAKKTTSKK